jgi:peptide/nickel transport system ATP-binding protein
MYLVPLLKVENLQVDFKVDEGTITVVNGVNLTIDEGEVVALVGESGSGKSMTCLSLLRLVSGPSGRISRGRILLRGEDLLLKSEREMQRIRGNDIAMIFQEPMTSLNPVFTVGDQLCESIILHQKVGKKEAWTRAIEMLRLVQIPLAEKRMYEYPHQLSGGMRQRVMIAMALSCNPKILIADEPTTALDVTIQAQIMELMKELNRRLGTAIILVSHDLGIVAEIADRVAVMYAGQVVEEADVEDLFDSPAHPYTRGLLECRPSLNKELERLYAIRGVVPDPSQFPSGCRFHPRCQEARTACQEQLPQLKEIEKGHKVRCWLATEQAAEMQKMGGN